VVKFEFVWKLVWKLKFSWGWFDELVVEWVQKLLLSQVIQTP